MHFYLKIKSEDSNEMLGYVETTKATATNQVRYIINNFMRR